MTVESSRSWRGVSNLAIILLIWEVIGRLDLVAGGALPGISEIVLRLWQDWGDYPRHIGATLYASIAGFIIGNFFGIAAGIETVSGCEYCSFCLAAHCHRSDTCADTLRHGTADRTSRPRRLFRHHDRYGDWP